LDDLDLLDFLLLDSDFSFFLSSSFSF
jgi:hypothetical protein